MIRRNFLSNLFVLSFVFAALSLTGLAQAKREPVAKVSGILRIAEVSKRDAAAKLVGKKRLVPVSVKLILDELIAEAKLQNVRLDLVTLNTDGTKTRISQVYDKLLPLHEMSLPMTEGVFAKSFTLNAVAEVLRKGVVEHIRASKSGSF